MIDWIQQQPVWLGLTSVIMAGVLLSTIGTVVANIIFTPEELIENNNVGGFKFAFLAQIVASLLAVCIVDSATRFVNFQYKVDREISAITLLAEMERVLPAQAQSLRLARTDYLNAVGNSEWKTMLDGEPSPQASDAIANWYRTALQANPKTPREQLAYAQYLRIFSTIMENRLGRISDATSPFEGLFWLSISIAVLITISFNWFFGSYSLGTQVAMGALLSGGVMTLVYLAIVMASPINSTIGISPDAYLSLALR